MNTAYQVRLNNELTKIAFNTVDHLPKGMQDRNFFGDLVKICLGQKPDCLDVKYANFFDLREVRYSAEGLYNGEKALNEDEGEQFNKLKGKITELSEKGELKLREQGWEDFLTKVFVKLVRAETLSGVSVEIDRYWTGCPIHIFEEKLPKGVDQQFALNIMNVCFLQERSMKKSGESRSETDLLEYLRLCLTDLFKTQEVAYDRIVNARIYNKMYP